jgi:hypothetical protein
MFSIKSFFPFVLRFSTFVVENDDMAAFPNLCIQQSTMISRAQPKIFEAFFILFNN